MSTPHLYPPGGLALSPPEADRPQGRGKWGWGRRNAIGAGQFIE